jgi:hypothetical protein
VTCARKGTALEPLVGNMRPDLASDPAPISVHERHLRVALEKCSSLQIVALVHAKLHLPADRRAFEEARRDLSRKALVGLAARTLVSIVPRKSGMIPAQR